MIFRRSHPIHFPITITRSRGIRPVNEQARSEPLAATNISMSRPVIKAWTPRSSPRGTMKRRRSNGIGNACGTGSIRIVEVRRCFRQQRACSSPSFRCHFQPSAVDHRGYHRRPMARVVVPIEEEEMHFEDWEFSRDRRNIESRVSSTRRAGHRSDAIVDHDPGGPDQNPRHVLQFDQTAPV